MQITLNNKNIVNAKIIHHIFKKLKYSEVNDPNTFAKIQPIKPKKTTYEI